MQVALDLPAAASVLDVELPVGSVQDASSNLFAGTDAAAASPCRDLECAGETDGSSRHFHSASSA